MRLHREAPHGAMPAAAQALGVARHIRSEPEVDPVALAHEMIILLRSVRTLSGAVSARAETVTESGVCQLIAAIRPAAAHIAVFWSSGGI